MAGNIGGYVFPQGGGGTGGGGGATSGNVSGSFTAALQVADSTFQAAEAISGGRAVGMAQSGGVRIAMGAVSGRMPAVGVVRDNILSGAFVTVYERGQLFNNSSGTPFDFSGYTDLPIYVGRSGNLIASGAPNLSGDVQQIMGVVIAQSGMMVGVGDPLEGVQIQSGDIISGTVQIYDCASGLIVRAAQFVSPFASGSAWSMLTGEIISGVRAVCISQSGFLQQAMASVSGRMPAIGVVNDNVLSGLQVNVYMQGFVQFTSGLADYSGYLGKAVWVGRSGQVVTWSGSFNSGGLNLASGGDFVQRLGVVANSGAFVCNTDPSMSQTQLLGTTTLEDTANRNFGV